jgi:hypothetical protein
MKDLEKAITHQIDTLLYGGAVTRRWSSGTPAVGSVPRNPHRQPTTKERLDKLDKTARSLSCPHCHAQPGEPCHKPYRKRTIAGLHHLRRIKAGWVVDNGQGN